MFEVKIIEDSIAPCDKRLTTITATYPRFIHAEIMTHRDRARNAASSRAIPWPKMKAAITENPVVPIVWGVEQSGMQTGGAIPEELAAYANELWLEARDKMVEYAEAISNIGRTYNQYHVLNQKTEYDSIKIHKSLPNRLTEPWMWITVVMTATEWANFFRLRCHPDAEIHFQCIANMIRHAMGESVPIARDYHLPFVTSAERKDGSYDVETLCRVSTARCARVSYLTHEGTVNIDKDLGLFDKLVQGSGFGHFSPHEHPAKACNTLERSGPFIGWKQYRKQFPLENVEG